MSQEPTRGLSARAVIGAALQLAVSVTLVVWAVDHADLRDLEREIAAARPAPVAAAFLLLFGQTALATWRWRRVNATLDVSRGYLWHWRLVMAGLFFGQVLPSTVGGDAYRIWAMARAGNGYGRSIVSIACDRALGLAALLVLIAAGLPVLAGLAERVDAVYALAAVVAVGLAGLACLVALGRLPFGLSRFRVVEVMAAPLAALGRILSDRREALVQAAIGLAIHLLTVLAMLALARALAVPLTAAQALAIVPAVVLFATVPVSIAGWGVREGAMIAAFALVGLDGGQAVVLSVCFGLASLAVGLAGAAVWTLSPAPAARAG